MMLLGDEATHTTEVLGTSSYCIFNHKLKLDLAFLERKIRLYVYSINHILAFLLVFLAYFSCLSLSEVRMRIYGPLPQREDYPPQRKDCVIDPY